MKTRSTEEAMAVLHEYRAYLIAYARHVAAELCRRHGVVHSRDVRRVMAERGKLDDPSIQDYWLGAVFQSHKFEPTGSVHTYNDPGRNIHERTVNVWRLRVGCENAYPHEPEFQQDPLERLRKGSKLRRDCIVVRMNDGYCIYE